MAKIRLTKPYTPFSLRSTPYGMLHEGKQFAQRGFELFPPKQSPRCTQKKISLPYIVETGRGQAQINAENGLKICVLRVFSVPFEFCAVEKKFDTSLTFFRLRLR